MNLEKIQWISDNLTSPVIFTGLMGAGKTSLGRALAESLHKDFVDIDDIIVEKEGRSIASIFDQSGEPYFRTLERTTTIETINNQSTGVIGIGGGAFMNDATRNVILEQAISIFLRADLDVLLRRVGEGAGRPLLQNNPETVLKDLIDLRHPVYEQAALIIETRHEPQEETLNRVIQALYNHLKPQ